VKAKIAAEGGNSLESKKDFYSGTEAISLICWEVPRLRFQLMTSKVIKMIRSRSSREGPPEFDLLNAETHNLET
jgi:hypothetical protein